MACGWFDGASHAQVERVLLRAVKNRVLEGGELRLSTRHIGRARCRTVVFKGDEIARINDDRVALG